MRASCFSFVCNFRQLSQPKLSMFECGAEQRSDLNNNFLLDSFSARAYEARTTVVYHIHLWARVINISNKFFEKILGEWNICNGEKWFIKFGEKGKRKTSKVVKSCSVNKQRLLYLHTKNVKPYFYFTWLCPSINKCSPTIKLYPESF